MIEEFKKLGMPKIFEDIWNSDAPNIIGCRFDTPMQIMENLRKYPDAFCKSEQLIPLWETNGHSLVGYLMTDKVFIDWAYEDGPYEYEIICNSYNGLLGYIFRSFLYSKNESELLKLAEIFELNDVKALINFKNSNEKWEEEIIQFLSQQNV